MSWAGADVVAFALSGHEGEFETGPGWSFQVDARAVVPQGDIPELERLWRELPDGEQARCHQPAIGFEVRRGAELVLRAALCYSCNNISTRTAEGGDARSFDATSAPAKALLRVLRAAL